ncbi:VOC family protein [Herbidospora mongoliensis]|uniref:VOC family protein n=1 Tax=Herbidospora mongoliensis TaxID=688067 RepID=UPI00082C62CD|nr:VOC family protein [Herbidospora mongoliensis]
MPGRVRYTAGRPCWVEVGTADLALSEQFYHGLFGWDFEPRGRSASTALLRGEPVAGLGPARPGGPAWLVHIAADDIDESTRRADDAGASVLIGPERIYDEGREQGWRSVLADPSGAEFALWEPVALEGAGARGVPGAFCWTELAARDADEAAAFYGKVLGWNGRRAPFLSGSGSYTEFDLKRSKTTVAGMVEMTDSWPPEIPPHWMVYFAVADCEESCRIVADLGGTVQIPPFDLPSGWAAVVVDPAGAVLSLIELTS